jgi:outer membrane protein assembly factor BamA
MRYTVGEAPVVLDSTKIRRSRENISNYLFKMGYFNCEVRDSIAYRKKGNKTIQDQLEVFFIVNLNEPYRIRNINLDISDNRLRNQIQNNFSASFIKQGELLDFNKLDQERDRITTFLKDRGYHFFNKEYIYFNVDSFGLKHQVDVTLGVKNMLKPSTVYPDSLVEVPHQRYLIANVYINTDYDPALAIAKKEIRNDVYDTLIPEQEGTTGAQFLFVYNRYHGVKFKPDAILENVFIMPAMNYRSKDVDATFRKLGSLGVFRTINIKFEINPNDPTETSLNCIINLIPSYRQNFSLESNGTNRGGNLGISGSFTYRNKNAFRGAELFRFTMAGGIEAQQVLANEDESIVGEGTTVSNLGFLSSFNTLEFGPEVSLSFPKFMVPFKTRRFDKYTTPHTTFGATFNYQQRPDFRRTIQDINFAYEWTSKDSTKKFYLSPSKVSAVKIFPTDSFTARLETINDQFLLNSYRDHFIIGNQFSLTHTNFKSTRPFKNYFYLKLGLEQSGNLLRLGYRLTGLPEDSTGKIFGIQFAHFVKADVDFRFNQPLNKVSKIVYRLAGGIGLPQKNFNQSLPFEKSFFVGGANGLRGWKARTLGPGSYMPAQLTFDKIGDIYMEGNLEYRFDLVGFVKMAMFVDAGNIWTLRPNSAREGSQISPNFYKEIAMDGGLGLRLDLDFFVLRLDFAIPLKEPGLMEGERWIFQEKTNSNVWLNNNGGSDYRAKVNMNIGIGYPF